ncbi:GntR family transcriptional regulator [Halobacillus litoralis]|uniref:GntR family transcriptional regulator n=1 Tax=Halobacillus litoralis TaxID=45668 RepID=A0A845FAL2_9BACI|nr:MULTISPECIES: GntR family transcriptional regulator [Halobacillus]MBN9654923.1 GntR family transcriptional regulator [Halobacillus sp. GSS1]MYL71432.1 GntR family transcriptional regulator [Halobacillus litoralis]
MILDTDGLKPIYIQIAEWLESEILHGNFQADEKVYSQYKLADLYNINPATAAKGLTKLAEEGVLYDKRGLGKFVSTNAKAIIVEKRKNQTLKKLVEDLVTEAGRLELSEEHILKLVRDAWKGEQG